MTRDAQATIPANRMAVGMGNHGEHRGPDRDMLPAFNGAIWFNWQIGAPVKHSLIAFDH